MFRRCLIVASAAIVAVQSRIMGMPHAAGDPRRQFFLRFVASLIANHFARALAAGLVSYGRRAPRAPDRLRAR